MINNNPNILITGGSGFLGSRIVEEFLTTESPLKPKTVKVYDKKDFEGPRLEEIVFIKGDVRDYDLLQLACEDVDIIIHCAAIIDWGTKSRKEVLDVNVNGTENVIKICEKKGIQHLVFTSSLDAVFTGRPLVDIKEDINYPKTYHSVYCESKVLGEKAVLQSSNDLNVCILRPSDIYGEADPYHIDALVDMAKKGVYVRLGNGNSKCQHVYVGNMAYAHVLAASHLWRGNTRLKGEIYFITDGPSSNFFKFFDTIILGSGYKPFPGNIWLPFWFSYGIGALSEFLSFLVRPFKQYNPKFSRFAVLYTCTDFTFSSKKALNDFNFKPKYTLEEALERTISYYAKR